MESNDKGDKRTHGVKICLKAMCTNVRFNTSDILNQFKRNPNLNNIVSS